MIPPAAARVVGIFFLNLYECDSTCGHSLPVAERLLNRACRADRLKVDDIWLAPEVSASIQGQAPPLRRTGRGWETGRCSMRVLREDGHSITIGLIVMVAALNIVASLVMLVMEKTADIAILKTMGASARSVMLVFMAQGLIIGLTGTVSGAFAGVGLSWLLDRYRLVRVPGDVYQISYVPFTLLPLDVATVVVLTVLVCFVATIYPSRQAARLKPAEALRNG